MKEYRVVWTTERWGGGKHETSSASYSRLKDAEARKHRVESFEQSSGARIQVREWSDLVSPS